MNKKIFALLLISTGLFFSACQKDSDIFVPDPGPNNGPDLNWYNTITPAMPVSALKNALAVETYYDSIQVNANNAYITTPFGLVCAFPPMCCVGNTGQTVTGTVYVEIRLIKKKGDMVRLNKPTTSNGRLLVSGGEIFIRLKKDSQDVQLAPNVKILLRYADLPINTQMKLFVGDESNPEQFNWLFNTDPANNTLAISPQNYEIQTNHLRWLSCDYFFDTAGINRTTVTTELAPQFTNANTIAFTVFKDFRSVVAMPGDVVTKKFNSIKLPVGKEISVIVISRQGNDYFMDHKTVITATQTSAPSNQVVVANPVITTLSNILTYLNTL